jgi:hypothetical protein
VVQIEMNNILNRAKEKHGVMYKKRPGLQYYAMGWTRQGELWREARYESSAYVPY